MNRPAHDIILGIDGGGTHTRVMAADLQGNVLAYTEQGSSSLHKSILARQNVHQAIAEAVAMAGRQLSDIRGIAAGVAGYDDESDREWVESLTDLEGTDCPKWHMNDAVIAHAGALMSEPGIVVISGTGSIIFAVTEDGRHIRNYDYHHYAVSAARSLAYDAVYEALAGNSGETDKALIEAMLMHWEMPSLAEFHKSARHGFEADRRERDLKFGLFAPKLTEAAAQGSRLAQAVCDRAVHQIAVGVELLAAAFESGTVPVAFIGSVVNTAYVKKQLTARLNAGRLKNYTVAEPFLPAVTGAALLALINLHVDINESLISRLQRHDYTIR